MTTIPSLRNTANDRAQGAWERRAVTTCPATASTSSSSHGLVVRDAAVASPSAHNHHAPGCRVRGSRGVWRFTSADRTVAGAVAR